MQSVKEAEGLPGTAFYKWFARYPVLLKKSATEMEFGDLAFGGGGPGVRPSFLLHIDLQRNEAINSGMDAHASAMTGKPRAWLIWREDRRSEMTLTSAPFHWLQ